MCAEGAVAIMNRKEIAEAKDPAARTKELADGYNRTFANPYVAASLG